MSLFRHSNRILIYKKLTIFTYIDKKKKTLQKTLDQKSFAVKNANSKKIFKHMHIT